MAMTIKPALKLTQRELDHLLDWGKLVALKYVYTKIDAKLAVKLKMMLEECYHENYQKRKKKIK